MIRSCRFRVFSPSCCRALSGVRQLKTAANLHKGNLFVRLGCVLTRTKIHQCNFYHASTPHVAGPVAQSPVIIVFSVFQYLILSSDVIATKKLMKFPIPTPLV